MAIAPYPESAIALVNCRSKRKCVNRSYPEGNRTPLSSLCHQWYKFFISVIGQVEFQSS